MSIKLIVWDWNGTLFDDTAALVEAINHSAVRIFNIPEMTVAQYQDIYEVPISRVYAKVGISKEAFDEASPVRSQAFLREYEPRALNAPLRDGAKAVLDFFAKAGVEQIILSNHTTEGIYQQLARFDITKYIGEVLANDAHEYVHKQGKSHRLHKFMDENHFEPQEVMIIGDTLEEIHIANELNITSVVITGGCCSATRLKNAKPDYMIDSLDTIKDIVEELA